MISEDLRNKRTIVANKQSTMVKGTRLDIDEMCAKAEGKVVGERWAEGKSVVRCH